MDWQNLFSPQVWGTFAPYLIVNMLLAAAFGLIGGWFSHQWTSKRDKANWERAWKTDLLREKRAQLEQIKTEIREIRYVARGMYPTLDETEENLLSQLGGIVTMEKSQDDQDTDAIALYELPTEFFVRLIGVDATLTGIVDQAGHLMTKSNDEQRGRTLKLVDDGRELHREINRLAQELGIRDW